MPSASVYPKTLDGDTQLIRRVGTDFLLPEDHNNLNDAIQAIEQTCGPMDDGTTGGGSQAFNCGLADYVGQVSTAYPNPRFPWSPADAASWYAVTGTQPAGWANGAGVSFVYNKPVGLAKATFPGTVSQSLITLTLTGILPFHVVGRIRCTDVQAAQNGKNFGFSVNGTGSDQNGWGHLAAAEGWKIGSVAAGGNPSTTPVGVNSEWLYFWCKHDGANVVSKFSSDGVLWLTTGVTVADANTPTVFVVKNRSSVVGSQTYWIDFLALGHTDPAFV